MLLGDISVCLHAVCCYDNITLWPKPESRQSLTTYLIQEIRDIIFNVMAIICGEIVDLSETGGAWGCTPICML